VVELFECLLEKLCSNDAVAAMCAEKLSVMRIFYLVYWYLYLCDAVAQPVSLCREWTSIRCS
jgi:hypothetical protein